MKVIDQGLGASEERREVAVLDPPGAGGEGRGDFLRRMGSSARRSRAGKDLPPVFRKRHFWCR
jgi:hypothetical protein